MASVKTWIANRLAVAPMFREGARMAGRVKLARWIADRLPMRVVYFAVIRAWVNATTGQWSHCDVTKVTVNDLCDRLEICDS